MQQGYYVGTNKEQLDLALIHEVLVKALTGQREYLKELLKRRLIIPCVLPLLTLNSSK